MVRPLVPSNDPVLRRPSIEVVDHTKLDPTLLDDMLETMRDLNGLGLAASQIGVGLRIFVIERGLHPEQIYINPKVMSAKHPRIVEEGCLSLPDFKARKTRYQELTLMAINRKGRHMEVTAKGIFATCIQHEMDHLRGVLIDRGK